MSKDILVNDSHGIRQVTEPDAIARLEAWLNHDRRSKIDRANGHWRVVLWDLGLPDVGEAIGLELHDGVRADIYEGQCRVSNEPGLAATIHAALDKWEAHEQ